jgi:hypothetical protein
MNFELQTLDLELGEAQQGIAEEEALKKGMEAKSKEFVEKAQRFTRRRSSLLNALQIR